MKNWGEERMEEFSRQHIMDPCVFKATYHGPDYSLENLTIFED